MAEQELQSEPLVATPAPAGGVDITAYAESLVQESRALNERLTEQLAVPQAEVAAAAAAAPVQQAPPQAIQQMSSQKSFVMPKKAPEKESDAVVAEVGCFAGITAENWVKILACLGTLYVCLGLYYWGLLEIAVYIRGGDQYKSLPTKYFGNFDRDYYYSEMGARRRDLEPLYPWIKATQCPDNIESYVCTPDCDVPTQNFAKPSDNEAILTCDRYNICCMEEDEKKASCEAVLGMQLAQAKSNGKIKKCVNP